jgi:hypothetical protein
MSRINKFAVFTLAFLFASVSLMAQEAKKETKSTSDKSYTGYVVDKMCALGMVKKGPKVAMEKAMKHTKACALEDDCAASGYGLVMDGRFFKFDEKGDKLAAEYLQKTKKKRELLVDVEGTLKGEAINVAAIADAKPEKK